jgi:predicted HTH domain antitoxin
MSLTISDEILQRVHMTPDELRAEIALLLYGREKLTLIEAAQMAQRPIEEFQRMIAGRALSGYDVDDFKNDLTTLRDLKRI